MTVAMRLARRSSSLRNGAIVTETTHGAAAMLRPGTAGRAMASSQICLSDDDSHQVTHSAFATGSPVSARRTRTTMIEAIALWF